MAKTLFLDASTSPAQFLQVAPQKIVVVDDAEFEEVRTASNSTPINVTDTDYTQLAWLGLLVGGPIGAAAGLILGGAIDVFSSREAERLRPYTLVNRSICSQVTFPSGHPQSKTAYVRHPFVNTLYYPISQFHQYLFQHKHLEAVRLLKSLGADSIEVRHDAGWSQEQLGKLNTPVGTTGVNAGVKAGTKRKSSLAVFYSAKLNPPKTRSIPKDLVWYDKEDQWRAIAEDVINNRVNEFVLEVATTETFGVDASVKTELAGLNLEVGGEFQDFEETKWTIKATFPKRRKASKKPKSRRQTA